MENAVLVTHNLSHSSLPMLPPYLKARSQREMGKADLLSGLSPRLVGACKEVSACFTDALRAYLAVQSCRRILVLPPHWSPTGAHTPSAAESPLVLWMQGFGYCRTHLIRGHAELRYRSLKADMKKGTGDKSDVELREEACLAWSSLLRFEERPVKQQKGISMWYEIAVIWVNTVLLFLCILEAG